MATRRKFLSQMGLGLFGSAAWLFHPSKLLAHCRRGRTICSPPCPMTYSDGCAMPLIPVVQPSGGGKHVTVGEDVALSYPPTAGGTIPGGGSFSCWGVPGNMISVFRMTCTDSAGNPLASQPPLVTNLASFIGPDFGFAISGYTGKSGFYIVFTYQKPNGMGGTTLATTRPFGPYST